MKPRNQMAKMDWNLRYDVHSDTEGEFMDSTPPTRNLLEMNSENLIFQQNDLFPSAFPLMADIRRQGKLCDVVLKVHYFKFNFSLSYSPLKMCIPNPTLKPASYITPCAPWKKLLMFLLTYATSCTILFTIFVVQLMCSIHRLKDNSLVLIK